MSYVSYGHDQCQEEFDPCYGSEEVDSETLDEDPLKIHYPYRSKYDPLNEPVTRGEYQSPSLDLNIGLGSEDLHCIKCPKILNYFSLNESAPNESKCLSQSGVDPEAFKNVVDPLNIKSQYNNSESPLRSKIETTAAKYSKNPQLKLCYTIKKKKTSEQKVKTVRKEWTPPWVPIPFVDRDEEGLYVCKFGNCEFRSKRRSNVANHIKAKHEPNFMICCHLLFPTKMHFDAHKLSCHKDGIFRCKIYGCNRKFPKKILLHLHEDSRAHPYKEIPPPYCCVCHKVVPKPEDDLCTLKAHARSHSCLSIQLQ